MTRMLALFILVLAAGSAGAQDGFDPFKAAGIDVKPGAMVQLDLAFRDAGGRSATLRELAAGKPVLLAPVVHRCPNICGVTLAGLAQAIRAQSLEPGRDFVILALGIDPREGADAATNSLDALRAGYPELPAMGVHALTGTPDRIAAVTNALGYRYAWDPGLDQYAHIAAVAVLMPDGRLAHWLYGVSPDPDDLKLALVEAGQGRVGTWGDRLLLLCYHYDPKTGRYGAAISWLLRLGGALTVSLGATFIGISLLRERSGSDGRS